MIAPVFGINANYLRRLRDEYDVVTTSTRKGQRNRAPRVRIIKMQRYLAGFSFEELTEIVKVFMANTVPIISEETLGEAAAIENNLSEAKLEAILNFKDHSATVRIRSFDNNVWTYNTVII